MEKARPPVPASCGSLLSRPSPPHLRAGPQGGGRPGVRSPGGGRGPQGPSSGSERVGRSLGPRSGVRAGVQNRRKGSGCWRPGWEGESGPGGPRCGSGVWVRQPEPRQAPRAQPGPPRGPAPRLLRRRPWRPGGSQRPRSGGRGRPPRRQSCRPVTEQRSDGAAACPSARLRGKTAVVSGPTRRAGRRKRPSARRAKS